MIYLLFIPHIWPVLASEYSLWRLTAPHGSLCFCAPRRFPSWELPSRWVEHRLRANECESCCPQLPLQTHVVQMQSLGAGAVLVELPHKQWQMQAWSLLIALIRPLSTCNVTEQDEQSCKVLCMLVGEVVPRDRNLAWLGWRFARLIL